MKLLVEKLSKKVLKKIIINPKSEKNGLFLKNREIAVIENFGAIRKICGNLGIGQFLSLWKKKKGMERDWVAVIAEGLAVVELGIYGVEIMERWILQGMEGILLGPLKITGFMETIFYVLDALS